MKSRSVCAVVFSVLAANINTASFASPVRDGSQLIAPTVSPVSDGNPNPGIHNRALSRETYYKNNHKLMPKGREVGSYYASWGIHPGRDYAPHQVPVERLTHVYVGFGGICGDNPAAYENGRGLRVACSNLLEGAEAGSYWITNNIRQQQKGEVSFIDDNWGYFDKPFTSPNGEYSGQLAGMIDWKNRNPNLKVIWSLGGWSYSRPFYAMANSASGRKLFIDSIIKWLSEPAMFFVDGVDLDWEFPGGEGADAGVGNPMTDGKAYITLLKELRAALNTFGKANNRHYELSAAIGVGPSKLTNFKRSGAVIKDMLPHLDRLGLMTYDFHGAWDNFVGFNTSLDKSDNDTKTLTIKEVVSILETEHNITDFSKISLGLAFYGRSHGNVSANGPDSLLGASANGAGPKDAGTVEQGSYSYFDLYKNFIGSKGTGINGWQVFYYPEYAAALLWNQSRRQAISYTPPKGIVALVDYAKSKNMMGVFSWTVDDDNGLLLEAIHQTYGHQDTTIAGRTPKFVHAPDCHRILSGGGQIKPNTLLTSSGALYKARGWLSKCPGQGLPYEQALWENITGQYVAGSGDETTTTDHQPPQPDVPSQSEQDVVGSPDSDLWSSSATYAKPGQIITHNGKKYKNKWYASPGEEPGKNIVWELIERQSSQSNEPSAWSAKVYSKPGTIVIHNGAKYKNKWYANPGEEPGKNMVWELIESQDSQSNASSAWSAKVYSNPGTIVIHNGVKYKNQWYAEPHDEPGVSAVWQRQ